MSPTTCAFVVGLAVGFAVWPLLFAAGLHLYLAASGARAERGGQ